MLYDLHLYVGLLEQFELEPLNDDEVYLLGIVWYSVLSIEVFCASSRQ